MSELTDVLVRADACGPEGDSEIVRSASALLRAGNEAMRPRTLAEALAQLGIRPFTSASVKTYQQAVVQRHNHGLARRWPGLVRLANMAWRWSFLLTGLCLGGWLVTGTGLAWLGWVLGGLLIIWSIVTAMRNGYWQVTPLGKYPGVVPPVVYERAGSLRSLLPDARFSVMHFKRDPFLLVQFGNEEAYTDVWHTTYWPTT